MEAIGLFWAVRLMNSAVSPYSQLANVSRLRLITANLFGFLLQNFRKKHGRKKDAKMIKKKIKFYETYREII